MSCGGNGLVVMMRRRGLVDSVTVCVPGGGEWLAEQWPRQAGEGLHNGCPAVGSTSACAIDG